MQDGLRPVEADAWELLAFCAGFGDLGEQLVEHGAGQVAALPVERQGLLFFGGLQCAAVDILRLGKGKLLFLIVRVCAVGAGRGRGDQRLVVAEDLFVVQIKIVVPDPGGGTAFLPVFLLPGFCCCALVPDTVRGRSPSDAASEGCE